MIFEEMLRDEYAEGKADSVLELLEELGTIPDALHEKIRNEKDLEVLKKWLKLAAKADSLETFQNQMNQI